MAGAVGIGLRPRRSPSTPLAGTRCRGTATRRGAPLTPGRPRPPPPSPARAGRRARGPGAPAGRPAVAGRPLRPPPAAGGRAGARRGRAVRGACALAGRPPPAAAGDLRGTRRWGAAPAAAGALRGRDAGAVARGAGGLAGRCGLTVRGALAVRPPPAVGGRAGARRAGARCDTAGARRAGARWRTAGPTARGAPAACPPPPPPRTRARARWGSPNAMSGMPTAAPARIIVASTIARCITSPLGLRGFITSGLRPEPPASTSGGPAPRAVLAEPRRARLGGRLLACSSSPSPIVTSRHCRPGA